jgi:AraC-like DNA-binding protein
MTPMTLYIKNMVCQRCVLSVQQVLQQLNIPFEKVILGEAHIQVELDDKQRTAIEQQLNSLGFELIDTRKNQLIDKIKKTAQEYLLNIEKEYERKQNLSEVISEKLHYEYSYLSDLFSSVEGTTIENYFISLRIERAKELIVYDEKNLTEISYQLGYSSVHHLSSQFKKITGLTPSHFKKIGAGKRKGLETI